MAFRASNLTLNENTFRDVAHPLAASERMTLDGVTTKTAILLFLCLGAGVAAYAYVASLATTLASGKAGPISTTALGVLLGSILLGFGLGILLRFVPTAAPWAAPIYALVEGIVLGTISQLYELQYHGLVSIALTSTIAVAVSMLALYRFRIVRVTPGLRAGIMVATGGIALVYLATLVLGLFGVHMPMIHDAGPWGIAFSLVVVGIAASNLLLDFDMIEQGVAQGAPKFMEWYSGFALLATLVWLYLEILRLLAKLRRR